jgi:hypothetical protein
MNQIKKGYQLNRNFLILFVFLPVYFLASPALLAQTAAVAEEPLQIFNQQGSVWQENFTYTDKILHNGRNLLVSGLLCRRTVISHLLLAKLVCEIDKQPACSAKISEPGKGWLSDNPSYDTIRNIQIRAYPTQLRISDRSILRRPWRSISQPGS